MNSRIKIYKIKTEAIHVLKEWGQEIMNDRLNEAVNSLIEENCIFEEARLFQINHTYYVIGCMISKPNMDFMKGPNSEINIKHKSITQNAIIEEISTELIYKVFTNLD